MALFNLLPLPISRLHRFTLLATAILLINHVPSIYAVLSILTHPSLPTSFAQFCLHIYSLLALSLAVYYILKLSKLGPSRPSNSTSTRGEKARSPSPSSPLSAASLVLLAHLHIIDLLLGIIFSVVFATTWFKMVSSPSASGPGSAMMNHTAGFTSPEIPVDKVAVDVTPNEDALGGQVDTTLTGFSNGTSTPASTYIHAFDGEGVFSLALLAILWSARAVLVYIVVLYARASLRDQETRNTRPETSKNGVLTRVGEKLLGLAPRFWGSSEYRILSQDQD